MVEYAFKRKSSADIIRLFESIIKYGKSGHETEYYDYFNKYNVDPLDICNEALSKSRKIIPTDPFVDYEFGDLETSKVMCDNFFQHVISPKGLGFEEVLIDAIEKQLIYVLKYLLRDAKYYVMNIYNYALTAGKRSVVEAMIFDVNGYNDYKIEMINNFKPFGTPLKDVEFLMEALKKNIFELVVKIMNKWDLAADCKINHTDFFARLASSGVFSSVDKSRVVYWFDVLATHQNMHLALKELFIKRKEAIPVVKLGEPKILSQIVQCGSICLKLLLENAFKEKDSELLNFLCDRSFHYLGKKDVLKAIKRFPVNQGMNWIKAIREVFDSTDNHKYEPLVYQSAKYELELALRDEKYDFALTLAKHFEFSLERKNSIKFFINKKAINIPTEMKFDQGVLNVIVSIHNFLKWKSSIFVSKFPSVEDWKKFNEYTIGISRNSYNYNPQIDLTAILDILWEQKYYALAIDFMIENQINPSLRELDFFISLKDKKILEGLERLVVQTRNVELSRRMLSGCYYVENGVVFLYIFSSENYEALQRCAHKDPSILHPPLANYLGTKHLISQCFSFDISASIIFNEAKKPENANTTLNAMSRLLAGQCRCSRSYNLRKYYLNWYIFKNEILSLKEDNIALFNLIVTTGLTPADLKLLHLELIN